MSNFIEHNNGIWDADYQYQLGDIITCAKLKYKCVQVSNHCIGSEPHLNSHCWLQIPLLTGDWVTTHPYQLGDMISYLGRFWTSLQPDNTKRNPLLNDEWWQEVSPSPWEGTTDYQLGDLVQHTDLIWKCIHISPMNMNHNPVASPAWWQKIQMGGRVVGWKESK